MGYRSQVGFVVPDTAPKFEEIEDACFDDVYERDGYRLYAAEWVKWYEDFEIVQAVEKYLDKLDEEDRYEDYVFVRIGEELADVDERGSMWKNPFEFGWSRQIVYHD